MNQYFLHILLLLRSFVDCIQYFNYYNDARSVLPPVIDLLDPSLLEKRSIPSSPLGRSFFSKSRRLESSSSWRPSIFSRNSDEIEIGTMSVGYNENHPFETKKRQRNRGLNRAANYNLLMDEDEEIDGNRQRGESNIFIDDDDNHREYMIYENLDEEDEVDDGFRPIRIKLITNPIESRRNENDVLDAQIDQIMNKGLPTAIKKWSKHLLVYPVSGAIEVPNHACFGNFQDIFPSTSGVTRISNADLVIIVSASTELLTPAGDAVEVCSESSKNLALGTSCTLDQYDRPIIGFINFCLFNDPSTNDNNFGRIGRVVPQIGEIVTKAFRAQPSTATSASATSGGNNAERNSNSKDKEGDLSDSTTAMVIHEIAHILAFDSYLFKFFRTPNGLPRTPRPFKLSTKTCTDGQRETSYFPSSNTIKSNRNNQGMIYFDVVTPRVQQVVRNHFNCQSLDGARIENQEHGNGGCIGSHWDERLHATEIMSPVLSKATHSLSPLTLALMEDSGWYKPLYHDVAVPSFGLGAGCDFVLKDCIVNGIVPTYGKDYFCNNPIKLIEQEEPNSNRYSGLPSRSSTTTSSNAAVAEESLNEIFCDATNSFWALCDLWDMSTVPSDMISTLFKSSYDEDPYFSNQNLRSSFTQADYCPMAMESIGIDCATINPNWYTEFYNGEWVGPSSRCINAFYGTSSTSITGRSRKVIHRPACMKSKCDIENRKVVLLSHTGDSSFTEITCEFDGQLIPMSVPNDDGEYDYFVECPKLSTICPQLFCPASCSGRGICDYDTYSAPKCTCFESDDTSSDGCYPAMSPLLLSQQRSDNSIDSPPTDLINATTNSILSESSSEDEYIHIPQFNNTPEESQLADDSIKSSSSSSSKTMFLGWILISFIVAMHSVK